MDALVEHLAQTFAATNDAVSAAVRECGEGGWSRPCRDEGRTVGVVAYHIAAGHALAWALVAASVAGDRLPPQVGRDAAHAADLNRHQATAQADCTRADVLALLRSNGETVLTGLRGLCADDLARVPIFAPRMTTRALIERVVIGHAQGHLRSIVATLDAGCGETTAPGSPVV